MKSMGGDELTAAHCLLIKSLRLLRKQGCVTSQSRYQGCIQSYASAALKMVVGGLEANFPFSRCFLLSVFS